MGAEAKHLLPRDFTKQWRNSLNPRYQGAGSDLSDASFENSSAERAPYHKGQQGTCGVLAREPASINLSNQLSQDIRPGLAFICIRHKGPSWLLPKGGLG